MPRIADICIELKKQGKKAFVVYIPFGFPSIKHTESILLTLQEAGVDIIELGIPFSDPLADGPIIQQATAQALLKGANPRKLFASLERMKTSLKLPLVIMTYYNPIFRLGLRNFFKLMRQRGISAIMVVDLPLEESGFYVREAKRAGIETVFFITPTTTLKRADKIAKLSQGFIYYISVTGITGPKKLKLTSLASSLRRLEEITSLPIYIGFGIHNPEQVKSLGKISEGVIVGSAVVKFIEKNFSRKDFLARLKDYILYLKGNG